VDHTTARRWIALLEASFLVMLLRPHHETFGKRLVRSPKLYFLDPGLLCSLLGIRSGAELRAHASRAAVFETFVLSELVKAHAHRGSHPPIHFWRESSGHEVDFLLERGSELLAIDASWDGAASSEALEGLTWWRRLLRDASAPALLVHGGDAAAEHEGVPAVPWRAL
jgi:predicted AAA+ superfamily ATPase